MSPRNDDLSLIFAKSKLNGFFPDVKNEELDVYQAKATTLLSDDAGFAAVFARNGVQPVNVKNYGAIGDGVADDSAAIQAALTAAGGAGVFLPTGTYLVPSATRLQMYTSYSSLIGDPSGISTIRFTHVNGGIDVGNGTDFIYQNLIQNVVIDGFNVANNPLRLRKSEEMGMENTRVHQALVTCIETTDTNLFHSRRLQVARAPIGIKTLGYVGTMGFLDANFYLLDTIVSVEGSGVTNLLVYGITFIEACKYGVSFNRPAAAISVGVIRFRDCYVTSALTIFSLFRAVAFSGLNASALDAKDCNFYIPSVTTSPFIDFTAVDNTGSTVRANLIDPVYTATALGAGKAVAVHSNQSWPSFFVTLLRIVGLTTAQYATTFVTGGVFLTPLQLSGSGTPEAAQTAPVGSIYQNVGGGAGTSFYVKQTGTGNTGWVGK